MPIEEDIKLIRSKREELKGQVESGWSEYNSIKDTDPEKAAEVASRYEMAREGVMEAEGLLRAKEAEYEGFLAQEQNRIFTELQEPGGAGFREIKSKTYVPSYGIPGAKESYDKVTYKRGKDTDKTIQSKLAEGLRINPEQVNMGRNISSGMTKVIRALGTPEEKAERMANQLDVDEVYPMKIGGEDNFLIKDKTFPVRRDGREIENVSYYLAFKPGSDKGKKLEAATTTEVPRIATAILGATKALAPKPGAGAAGKAGSLAKGSLLSSLGYEGVEAMQETLARGGYGGMDQDVGSRAIESTVDTGINLGIDMTTAGIARPISKRLGKPVIHEAQKGFQGAKENIKKQTGEVIDDAPYLSGSLETKARFGNMRRFKNSAIAREIERTESAISRIQKGLLGEGSTPAQRQEMVKAMHREYDDLAAKVIKSDKRAGKYGGAAIKREINRRKAQLANGINPNRRELGEQIIEQVGVAQERGRAMRDQAFGDFFQQADQAGVTLNRAQVADELDLILKQPKNKFAKDTKVHQIVDQLRSEAADAPTMGLEEYRGMIGEISDSTGVKAVGASTPQKIARDVDTRARNLMLDRVKGTPLEDSWANAVKVYDEASLAFNRSSPGKILAEAVGDTRISPEGATNALLQNSKNLDDYMAAMYATGDGAGAEATRKQLQAAFIEGGVTDSALVSKKPVIETLWGRMPDGSIDAAKAQRAVDALSEMNALQKRYPKANVKYSVDDIEELSGFIGTKQKDNMMAMILERNVQEAAEKKLLNNSIISTAKRDGWDVANSDQLANALMDSKPHEIRQVLQTLSKSPSTQQAVKQDMRNQFFRKYSSASDRHGDFLIDADKILGEIKDWTRKKSGATPDVVARMDAFGDKETTDLILDLARVRKEILPPVNEATGLIQTKFLIDQTGKGRIWAVSNGVKDWALAKAYGKPGFKSALRYALKDIGDEAANEQMNKAVMGSILSRVGMQAAIRRSEQDPQFAHDFQNMLAEIATEEAEK